MNENITIIAVFSQSGEQPADDTDITNHPPTLERIGNKTVNAGQELRFSVVGRDSDDDLLTYNIDNLPPGASFNEMNQQFSWCPNPDQSGRYPDIVISVSDDLFTVSESITITVNAAPQIPTTVDTGTMVGTMVNINSSIPKEHKISKISATDVKNSSVIIKWTTDVETRGQIKYHASPEKLSPKDETLSCEHIVELNDLRPNTRYAYSIISYDKDNNVTESEENTFVTTGNPATLEVSKVEVISNQITAGEKAVFRVKLQNIGDIDGSFDISPVINGPASSNLETKKIFLSANESAEIDFSLVLQEAGDYRILVGDQVGELNVHSGIGNSDVDYSIQNELVVTGNSYNENRDGIQSSNLVEDQTENTTGKGPSFVLLFVIPIILVLMICFGLTLKIGAKR
jgi:hypothetical protein